MSGIWQASTAILWLVTWLSSPPASLADAATREAMRRQASPKAAATLTNLGKPVEPPPAAAVSMPMPAVEAGSTQSPAAPAKAASSGPAKDEAWWRARMTDANQALTKDQLTAQAFQAQIDALQRDVVNVDDPVRQSKARQDLDKALGELDRLKKQVEADQKAIEAIRDEGRRLNVPPGWIR
jgi:hypothetical protein